MKSGIKLKTKVILLFAFAFLFCSFSYMLESEHNPFQMHHTPEVVQLTPHSHIPCKNKSHTKCTMHDHCCHHIIDDRQMKILQAQKTTRNDVFHQKTVQQNGIFQAVFKPPKI